MKTVNEKLDKLRADLVEAQKDLRRQGQWVGERFGAIAATKAAERRVNSIQFQIEKIEFAEHNTGNCNPETCSDCFAHKIAPNDWIARGANDPEAVYTK